LRTERPSPVISPRAYLAQRRPGEVVHHIDEDKTNCDPSNLMVFPSQAAHAAHHAKLAKEVTQ
jgi:hypothetical protein